MVYFLCTQSMLSYQSTNPSLYSESAYSSYGNRILSSTLHRLWMFINIYPRKNQVPVMLHILAQTQLKDSSTQVNVKIKSFVSQITQSHNN